MWYDIDCRVGDCNILVHISIDGLVDVYADGEVMRLRKEGQEAKIAGACSVTPRVRLRVRQILFYGLVFRPLTLQPPLGSGSIVDQPGTGCRLQRPYTEEEPSAAPLRAEQPGTQKKQKCGWRRVAWTQWYTWGHLLHL